MSIPPLPPGGRGRPLPSPAIPHPPSSSVYPPALPLGLAPPPSASVPGAPSSAPPHPATSAASLDAGSRFGEAPPGYVAGRGRGLGDTRRAALEAQVKARLKQRRAEAADGEDGEDEGDEDLGGDDDERGLEEDDVGLFANAVYEEDDREADEIYAAVDARMDSRRHKQREARIQMELENYRRENPTLKQQFSEMKRGLADISEDEWANIPDIGDYRVKRQKMETFTPVPDIVIDRARRDKASSTTVDDRAGERTDLTSIGEGRGAVLGQKLDRLSDSVTGQTNVDPTGYLTELSGIRITSNSDIGDIKKARLLLKSVTSTNPKHAPGWIAALRLEELAGRMPAARDLAAEGCRLCPKSEDMWLEAARIHPRDQAKRVLASAVQSVPKSVKIWIHAAALEDEAKNKRRVLRKALEFVPTSAKLWRAAVDLEEPKDAKILLERAVKCAPQALDLWMALSKLSDYEGAKKVLNEARRALPAEPTVWLTAAKLEESNSDGKKSASVMRIIESAVAALSTWKSIVNRDRWMKEAKEAEDSDYPQVCVALVNEALELGIEKIDRLDVWRADANTAEAEKKIITARAIHSKLAESFPAEKDVWYQFAEFEKRSGNDPEVQAILKRAVGYCPQAEPLWLLWAREVWLSDNVDECRRVLEEAFRANPNSEEIWLEAAKVERETGQLHRARALMERARNQAPSGRVYMKSALLERQARSIDAERKLLLEGLEAYPEYWKMWVMLAQSHERQENFAAARASYNDGLKSCPTNVQLCLGLAHLERDCRHLSKARAVLERGRQRNPRSPDLWLASVRLERISDDGAAGSMLARGLKECPQSGLLWAEAIEMESRPRKKARSVDALKHCDKDARVMVAVARLFWTDHKVDKARNWLERAVALDPKFGDGWASLHRFETQYASEDRVAEVVKRCMRASPTHGEAWCRVSKAVGQENLKTFQILTKVSESLSV